MNNQNTIEKIIDFLKKGNREKAESLKLEIIPSSLYRYRKVDNNTIDCLKRKSIWLSNFRGLNDPFDCITKFSLDKYTKEYFIESNFDEEFFINFGVSLSHEEINIIRNSNSPQETYYEIAGQKKISKFAKPEISTMTEKMLAILEKYREYSYVGCFSERSDSSLMWSHYADSGKGICIEYNLKNIDLSYLFPVFYSDSIYDFSIKEAHIPVRSLIKAKDWEYEHEWRLVYYSDKMKANNQYAKIPIPTKILLGPLFDANNKDKIDELTHIADNLNIPLVKTKLHPSEYKVIIEPVLPDIPAGIIRK